ncbi:MAG: tryptophan synthase subunit alpha [Deltaproteobacteria bacterium]|nr:tryptophan synthase subunit alpha [Deltaproteobacteria bacterium]
MGRIEATFNSLRERGEKALITFITAGDPDIKTTGELIIEFEKRGADIIELGIPFSDPMADGPTIQAASERALKDGTHISDILGLIGGVRERSEIPIILFGYYNPIFAYGIDRFARDARRAGADGVLVVDLPPEEADELKGATDREGLDLVYLLTPTSDKKRMRQVARRASGFIYYISVAGVTGAREGIAKRIGGAVKCIRDVSTLPVCVGFGISTPDQAGEISRRADGVIVGSAIVKVIEENIASPLLVRSAGKFVARLKRGMSNVR